MSRGLTSLPDCAILGKGLKGGEIMARIEHRGEPVRRIREVYLRSLECTGCGLTWGVYTAQRSGERYLYIPCMSKAFVARLDVNFDDECPSLPHCHRCAPDQWDMFHYNHAGFLSHGRRVLRIGVDNDFTDASLNEPFDVDLLEEFEPEGDANERHPGV
jgi:hypothetical protein